MSAYKEILVGEVSKAEVINKINCFEKTTQSLCLPYDHICRIVQVIIWISCKNAVLLIFIEFVDIIVTSF